MNRSELYQGRDPAFVLRDERTLMRLIPTLYHCAIVAAVLFLVALAGCAEPIRTYTEGTTVFHEGDISPCERGAAACTIGVPGAYQVFYAHGDGISLAHERMHLLGGMHGQWVMRGFEVCAQVTQQGQSDWIVGNWLCRQSSGLIIQRGKL